MLKNVDNNTANYHGKIKIFIVPAAGGRNQICCINRKMRPAYATASLKHRTSHWLRETFVHWCGKHIDCKLKLKYIFYNLGDQFKL